MGIPANDLKLRITSVDIDFTPARTYVHLSYEIFHEGTGAVVAWNKLAAALTNSQHLQEVDERLVERAIEEWATARWQYGSSPALSGYSPFDVSLILEWWAFERDGADWKMSHPLSGTYEGVSIPTSGVFPVIVERAKAVISQGVAPPPTWAWASSPGAGQLEAHCVAVPNADSYAVYHDQGGGEFVLLAEPASHNGATFAVDAGAYTVRMAAVKAGVVGTLGRPVSVRVE